MSESTLNFATARKVAAESNKSSPEGYPVTSKEHGIRVRYHAPDGEYYDCELLSVIMSDEERAFRGRAAATVAGVPWEQLPPSDRTRIYMQATVTTQSRKIPTWLFDSSTGKGWLMQDDLLCARIYQACEEHEARYLRRYGSEGGGNSKWSPVSVDSGFSTPPDGV